MDDSVVINRTFKACNHAKEFGKAFSVMPSCLVKV